MLAKLTYSLFIAYRRLYLIGMMLRAGEKKRRQIYRGDVQGLMPFDVRGMDDAIPAVEITSILPPDNNFTIGRADIEGMPLTLPHSS